MFGTISRWLPDRRLTCLCLFGVVCGLAWSLKASETDALSWRVGKPGSDTAPIVELPGDLSFIIEKATSDWTPLEAMEFDIVWPADAPTNAQVLAYVQDWDYYWYQQVLPGALIPGETNALVVPFGAHAERWQPVGHHAAWHYRALMKPVEVGVRVFGSTAFTGPCRLENLRGIAGSAPPPPPRIRRLRANTTELPCYETLEVSFELPDRYRDPFDPDEVSVLATVQAPSGKETKVRGFYTRDFYRERGEAGERLVPQGAPYWQVRVAPLEEGRHLLTLQVQDRHGSDEWGALTFEATPPLENGFVRVSEKDPRYFELTDGTFFFPIGHNLRSPFDTRMNTQFAWRQRWPEGSLAYDRYFEDMSNHGENLAEVWTASWSLGLEWRDGWAGYHGVGQYNLHHAWELDRVIDMARKRGLRINLVINNHGKFSSYSDEEWEDNPYNTANGGYLDSPSDFFSDPRAMADFRKLMRYMTARWGHSTTIFAWELWSELDLTGTKHNQFRRPAVVEWHRLMGDIVNDLDPYKHLVATHVSGDYTSQYDPIVTLPQMDFCPVDAYHNSRSPLHIVTLMKNTARRNNAFEKPVLITEFGGTPQGEGLQHLRDSLHAALWASTCTPVGGTPMFWWWQLIEEENYYPMYQAVNRAMAGQDLRDPDLRPALPTVRLQGQFSETLGIQAMASKTHARGWLYDRSGFSHAAHSKKAPAEGITVAFRDMDEGTYSVTYIDTSSGEACHGERIELSEGQPLTLTLPALSRDIAFRAEKQ